MEIETCRKIIAEGKQCGAPLDRTGTPKWCKACWAAYQKSYQHERIEAVAETSESRGYCAGIKAMRDYLTKEFDRLGSGQMTGTEAAMWIRSAPGPQ